ncbi:MAG: hypothetical protein PG981_000036 [Wolbachia endosymbiont of Ctenocephalides orientis wCori]|nr:MAG: hypothetical protein PG981_000036 [Wolbachia endosymbiont of Ctenocephalides orientis wCori]
MFSQENFNLLQLAVGNQKYIEIFIGEFHNLYSDSLSSTKLTDQTLQLGILNNEIGFFSFIALRKEQNLLDAVLVEYALRDFAQALETGKKNDLYGISERVALAKNEGFIKSVLDAFERDVSNLARRDLLKNSFISLLATAMNQEHVHIVKYLCKKCAESKDSATQKIYEEALAGDKILNMLKEHIFKKIEVRGRRNIYDLILEIASNVDNIECIEKILDLDRVKNDSQLLRESLTTVLNKTESSSVIECLLKKYGENIISELESDKIEDHAALNVLNGAVKLAKKAIDAKDIHALSSYFTIIEAGVACVPREKGLSVIKQLTPMLTEFASREYNGCGMYPINNNISDGEYEIVEDLNSKLRCLEENIADHASYKLSRSDSRKGSSPDISDDEVHKKAGNLTTEENNDTTDNQGPVKGFLSNSNDFQELNMGKTKNNKNIGINRLASPVRTKIAGLISRGSSSLREELELILKNASPKQVLQYIQDQKGGTNKNEAEEIVKSYIKNNKKDNHSKAAKEPVCSTESSDAELSSSSNTEGHSSDSGRSSGSPSGQSTPVDGGAGSATDNGAPPSPSKVSKEADKLLNNQDQPSDEPDGNQSDTSKKSARTYNIAVALLLGGGVGAAIAAPVMYFVFMLAYWKQE